MKSLRGLWAILVLTPMMIPLTNCISSGSGSESGTEVGIAPAPDPDSYACDPFDGNVNIDTDQGIQAQISYLSNDQPRYGTVVDYMNYAHIVDNVILYLNQVYIPTRPFDRGFSTMAGELIADQNGNALYEYFALHMEGRIHRGRLPAGNYQFAMLADDGAVFDMDFGNGFERVVDDDGTHPTKFACGQFPVTLEGGLIPFQLNYYQGPRYHIAAVLMARPWPADNNANDVSCGTQGNSLFFDSTQDPPAPSATYNAMLARGWAPLQPENFYLPVKSNPNPCNTAAPVISNFQFTTTTQTSITVSWGTDVPASSQIGFEILDSGNQNLTIENMDMVTAHSVVVSGLLANTTYVLKAISKSSSGLSSESGQLAVRTRR